MTYPPRCVWNTASALRRLSLLLATALFAVLPASTAAASAIQDAVNAAAPPSLTITGADGTSPPADGPGGVKVTWVTGTGVVAGLTRSIDGGKPEQIGFYRPVATELADGAPPQARQVFKLTQAGLQDGKVLITAVVQNGKVQVLETNRPVAPRDTPDWIDEAVRLAPWAIIAFFGVLIGLYLWSLRELRRPTEPVDA